MIRCSLEKILGLESQADSAKVKFCIRAVVPDYLLADTMKKITALLVLAGIAQIATAADVVGNAQNAKAKIEMCIGCHGIPGYKATFPEVFQVPMIGGQSAKYIESALKAYQKGDRKHPSMKGIASSLSDQDIADVAAFYSQQTATTAAAK
jgi:cytochrome c553